MLPHNLKYLPAARQKRFGFSEDFVQIDPLRSPQRAFPDGQYAPSLLPQRCKRFLVPLNVPCDFLQPKVGASAGHFEQMAVMPVPKASVNENDCLITRKRKIGTTRQRALVEHVPESEGMQPVPEEHLGFCVFPPDATHVQVSLLTSQNIGHKTTAYRILPGLPRRRGVAPAAARRPAIASTLSIAS